MWAMLNIVALQYVTQIAPRHNYFLPSESLFVGGREQTWGLRSGAVHPQNGGEERDGGRGRVANFRRQNFPLFALFLKLGKICPQQPSLIFY